MIIVTIFLFLFNLSSVTRIYIQYTCSRGVMQLGFRRKCLPRLNENYTSCLQSAINSATSGSPAGLQRNGIHLSFGLNGNL